MILRNNLYKIISKDEDAAVFEIELLPDCVIYKSHFPGMPITPGVCIIQIACELLEEYTSEKLQLTDVGNAKFLSVINPLETRMLKYTIKKTSGDEEGAEFLKATVVVSDETTVYAKLSLRLENIS